MAAVLVEHFFLGCLAHASYLVGSEGVAAVIDPQRDVDIYIDAAREKGLKIEHIIETHLHADFVSGHHELAERTGARIYVGEDAHATFPHTAIKDGDTLQFGNARFDFLHTPAHTIEGVCAVLTNLASPSQPRAVFTGDPLFVGDVGRPDLSADHTPQQLAALLYQSLHEKILKLPDDTEIFPPHAPGSLCPPHLRPHPPSPLGNQPRTHYPPLPRPHQEFIHLLPHTPPPRPRSPRAGPPAPPPPVPPPTPTPPPPPPPPPRRPPPPNPKAPPPPPPAPPWSSPSPTSPAPSTSRSPASTPPGPRASSVSTAASSSSAKTPINSANRSSVSPVSASNTSTPTSKAASPGGSTPATSSTTSRKSPSRS